MTAEALLVVLGALAGGFISGLTGFGTGLTALPVWLLVLSPVQAASLVVVCSVVGQLQTLPAIWHKIDWRRVSPFIAGGIIGVPAGTSMLAAVSPVGFKAGIGALMIVYCTTMLLARFDRKLQWGGRAADGAVGVFSGILGGIAGLSGILPTIWTDLRGWDKTTRRSVFQGFNLTILTLALGSHAIAGFLTRDLAIITAMALAGTIIGAFIGRRVYDRLPDTRFNHVILVLLTISGAVMVVSNLS
ncbi:MAG: sulfite exporter TauE/SafE family protein [Hyphomicrobiaceae bacterium]